MGSGNWFRAIIRRKKPKEDKSKQVKADSAAKTSNGSKWKHLTGKVSSSHANGASTGNATHLSVPIEEIAAKRIQNAYRAYKARKALHHLRGTARVQALIEGHSIGNQTSNALSHIHSWSRIQAHIRARRFCMVAEGRARQKKLENQLKLEAKLHDLQVEWCGGSETMEEILSRIQQREEAAVKRERAMAYAFSHQWRANSSQYFGQAYYDLGKESWGWSWMERWIAVRPWESRVHVQAVIPKKVQTGQGGKVNVGRISNQQAMKTLVSVKPATSNGKETAKARKLSHSSAQKQELQEAKAEVLILSHSENGETNTKQEQVIA